MDKVKEAFEAHREACGVRMKCDTATARELMLAVLEEARFQDCGECAEEDYLALRTCIKELAKEA